MGFWSQLHDLAGGSRTRVVRALTDAWRDEVRLARQLRLHAEAAPYPEGAAQLRALAERAQARATELGDAITREHASVHEGQNGHDRQSPRGRNYWQRLTNDLEDLRALSQRYRELANSLDDYPETAALFARLSTGAVAMIRVVTGLIALSDPHAAD